MDLNFKATQVTTSKVKYEDNVKLEIEGAEIEDVLANFDANQIVNNTPHIETGALITELLEIDPEGVSEAITLDFAVSSFDEGDVLEFVGRKKALEHFGIVDPETKQ